MSMSKADIRKAMRVTYENVLMDKTQADALLKRNKGNRPFKLKKIITMKKSWNRGHWKFNGDTIRLDTKGNVIDGQNRLRFVSEMDIQVPMVICKGLERESQTTMDSNSVRTFSDWLKMNEYENYTIMAPAIRALIPFYAPDKGATKRIGESLNKYEVTIDEQIELFKDIEPVIIEGAKYAFKSKQGNPLSPAQTATLYHIFSKNGGDLGLEFMDEVCKGINLEHGSPSWKLRNYLTTRKAEAVRGKGASLRASYIYAIAIKTWNYWVQDEDMPSVELRKGYDFPIPIEA